MTRNTPPKSSPSPWEWGGEHYSVTESGVLALWSLVRTEAGEHAVHRASLRSDVKGTIWITFDSPSVKAAKRRWRRLTHATLLSLPRIHRDAAVQWRPAHTKGKDGAS